MKHLIIATGFISLLSCKNVAVSQISGSITGPDITLEKDTIDYGTIPYNSNNTRLLKVTNRGAEPLVIKDILGSGPNYAWFPKEPLYPWATETLKTYYYTGRVGRFMKTLTIISNALEGTKMVWIKGTILPDTTTDKNVPIITFEKDTINYGIIAHNSDGNRYLKFTNTGKEPLMIDHAYAEPAICSCPHYPVLPGKFCEIRIHYPTDRVGRFIKAVTVESNARNRTKIAWITGYVLPDTTTDKNVPIITFEKDTLEYGTLIQNQACKRDSISFTNTGKEPLLIREIHCSGEAVIPWRWPNYPILPGQSSQIKFCLLRDSQGSHLKTLIITSNASKTKVLYFQWKVVADTADK